MQVPAPFGRIPLYVRGGSILPMGPDIQWSGEQPGGDLELCIYPGRDCGFVLYDDDGESYGYERGEFSTVPLEWNDADGVLTIGEREGSFPGMAASRKITVRLMGPRKASKELVYDGSPFSVRF